MAGLFSGAGTGLMSGLNQDAANSGGGIPDYVPYSF
jgi:hypothetical protein